MKQTAFPSHELATLSYSMMERQAPQSFGNPTNPVPKICCQITFEDSNKKADSLHVFFDIMKLCVFQKCHLFSGYFTR